MWIPVFFVLHASAAEPAVRKDAEGLFGGGNTIEFTVLDINAHFAAARHVYTLNDEEERPVPCTYPGLEEHPTAGLALALFELNTGKVTTFDVYETAHDGGSTDTPKPCTERAAAKKQRDAAKAAFKKAGLDPDTRPQPKIDYATRRGSRGEPLLPSVIPVGVDLHEDGSETHVYTLELHWKEHPMHVKHTVEYAFQGSTTVELADKKQVFYRATRDYDLMQAGTGDIRFEKGYTTPAGMVFVEVFHSFTAMRDAGHSFRYGMTPPIPEWSPWVELAFELQPEKTPTPASQTITLRVGQPGKAPSRFDIGELEGPCFPFSSTTPTSLSVSCPDGGRSVTIQAKKEGDFVVVDKYVSRTSTKEKERPPERLHQIPLPPNAHIRTLLGF